MVNNLEIIQNLLDEETNNIEENDQQTRRGRAARQPIEFENAAEVRAILQAKIAQEMEEFTNNTDDNHDNAYLQNIHYAEDKINVLSLFSGCGGLDLGFELAGLAAVIGEENAMRAFQDRELFMEMRDQSIFHTIYTNDLFREANATYRENFPDHVFQHEMNIKRIRNFPRAELVIGGFPCPGFSEAGPRLLDDERNFLYLHFIRCLLDAQPAFFIAENVKGLMTLGGGEVLNQIKEDFGAAGYRVKAKLLNSRDYGVPQLRERVIIVGVREDIDFEYEYPVPTHGTEDGQLPYVTIQDAIGDLEAEPGPFFTGSYSSIYMSRNRKKRWNEQSFTIQASGRQAPLHPSGEEMVKVGPDHWIFPDGEENHRRLSVKEIARIQTFPDWYRFNDGGTGSVNNRLNKQYKQIGNAVPVLLAKAVAMPIARWATRNIIH